MGIWTVLIIYIAALFVLKKLLSMRKPKKTKILLSRNGKVVEVEALAVASKKGSVVDAVTSALSEPCDISKPYAGVKAEHVNDAIWNPSNPEYYNYNAPHNND
ncbi:hypothetical protein FIP36_16730 [Salmonella enterica]|nr:hypothetical protein [Salmonella enterica]